MDKIILFGVFLELVSHSAHNVLDLALKELAQGLVVDVELVLILLLNLLLVIKDSHDLSVVVSVLFSALTIVQIDQHVSQELVQSSLDVVGLGLLILLPLLRMTLVLVLLVLLLLLLRLVAALSLAVLLLLAVMLVALGPSIVLVSHVSLILIILLATILGLLIILLLAILPRLLSLEATWVSRLAVMGTVLALWGDRPLLVLDLVADLVFLVFFGAIDALLLFSVFFFALLFTLFIIGFGAHVFSLWLRLARATTWLLGRW